MAKPKRKYRGGGANSAQWASNEVAKPRRPIAQAHKTPVAAPVHTAPIAQPAYHGLPDDDASVAARFRANPALERAHHASPVKHTSFSGTRAGKITNGVALGGALAGTGYLIHRHRKAARATMAIEARKKAEMSKSLINPFEEVVVFGKAYPVALPVAHSTKIRALVPTGAHVGHGNKLVVVHGGGPKITRQQLQTYHGHGRGLSEGPFGKSLFPFDGAQSSPSAGSGGGLGDSTNSATSPGKPGEPKKPLKPTAVKGPTSPRRSIPNSNIPDASSKGSRIA
jgi:hypothetical protein